MTVSRTSLRFAFGVFTGCCALGIGLSPQSALQTRRAPEAAATHATCSHAVHPCYAPGTDVSLISESYVLSGTGWPQPGGSGTPVTITYSYSNLLNGGITGLTNEQMVLAVEEALSIWASYAPFEFVEVPDSGPLPSGMFDVNYDGTSAPNIRFGHHFIDGPSNVLAHAYYPSHPSQGLAGDVHFDSGDNWGGFGIGLFLEVCVHEIGHSIGMGHEPRPQDGGDSAIMNPVVSFRFPGLGDGYLLQDDIDGIEFAYGAGMGSVTPLDNIDPPPLEGVAAAFENGTLTLVSDDSGNEVLVLQIGAGVLVLGRNGTLVNDETFVLFSGATLNTLDAEFGNGADVLMLLSVDLDGTLNLGGGDDRLYVLSSTIDLQADGEAGTDWAIALNSTTTGTSYSNFDLTFPLTSLLARKK